MTIFTKIVKSVLEKEKMIRRNKITLSVLVVVGLIGVGLIA